MLHFKQLKNIVLTLLTFIHKYYYAKKIYKVYTFEYSLHIPYETNIKIPWWCKKDICCGHLISIFCQFIQIWQHKISELAFTNTTRKLSIENFPLFSVALQFVASLRAEELMRSYYQHLPGSIHKARMQKEWTTRL